MTEGPNSPRREVGGLSGARLAPWQAGPWQGGAHGCAVCSVGGAPTISNVANRTRRSTISPCESVEVRWLRTKLHWLSETFGVAPTVTGLLLIGPFCGET